MNRYKKAFSHSESNDVLRITNGGAVRDVHEIYELLKEYNLSHREVSQNVPSGVFLEDGMGRKLAGLTGETFSDWFWVRFIFVREQRRSRKIGSRLLEAAEREARQRGCKYAFADTFFFQTPEFYKNHGYQEAFVLEEYPCTGKRHYYTKNCFDPDQRRKLNEMHRHVDRGNGYGCQ